MVYFFFFSLVLLRWWFLICSCFLGLSHAIASSGPFVKGSDVGEVGHTRGPFGGHGGENLWLLVGFYRVL